MNKIFFYSFISLMLITFSSCNQDEGLGGSSSLEGYVYNIVHYDDNYTFRKDTFPAAKEDVFLIFGSGIDDYFGEDVETDNNGFYRFNFLKNGNYVVYSFSELSNKQKVAEYKKAKVDGKNSRADTIFINTGSAYGTSIISGKVEATYYHNGSYRDSGPGTGMRAYIRHKGESAYFDDVRVVDGLFYFQKLMPGRYEVAVETEDKSTEAVFLIVKSIEITKTGVIYEIPGVYEVNVSV